MKTVYPAPVKNILDGITDATAARNVLRVPSNNGSKDEMTTYFTSNDMVLSYEDSETGDRYQIKGDHNEGIRYEKRIDNTWTTIPVSVNRGGTGALTAANARKNLGFSPTSFNLTAGSGITLASQYNFKYGDLVIVNFRWTASSAIGDNTTIATIPSGYRPTATVSAIAISPNNTGVPVAIGVGSDGKIYSGSGTVASRQYRVQAIYHV